MPHSNHLSRRCVMPLLALMLAAAGTTVAAQDDADDQPAVERRDPRTNRRISDRPPVVLNFNNVSVSETLEFIVETTGKTVIPSGSALASRITVVNDVPLPRDEALNRLFTAFLDFNIGVVETPYLIKIMDLTQIARSDCPVIGADESLLARSDEGVIVNKIFQLRYASAYDVATVLQQAIPDMWAQVEIEPNSNSIIALCSIGLGKKLERIVNELDRSRIGEVLVIVLDFADATSIADLIMRTYGPSEEQRSTSGQPRTPTMPGGRPPGGGGAPRSGVTLGGGGGDGSAPIGGVMALRAVPDARNNTVTVVGEPSLLRTIERRVKTDWDKPLAGFDDIVRTYSLKYRDVIVIRDLLNQLGGASGQVTGARAGTRVGADPGAAAAAGGGGGAFGRISDLFFFQADPGANQLIVAAKTRQSFDFIEQLIEELDQPNQADRPTYIELKHADAFSLAQQINVVYSREGVRGSTETIQQGLTEFQMQGSTGTTTGAGGVGGTGTADAQATEVTYPWQQGTQDPNTAPVSPLIGKFRVMPVQRQNAVLIVGPPHYREHIAELIEQLDKPGRQVLITGVIAEVQLVDGLSLGLRFSSGAITPSATDNVISIGAGLDASRDDVLSGIFDTSVLDVSANLNVIFEALKQKTHVRILSEPRIFTHDNEQANFFDGQDVQVLSSIITDIQSTNLNQSFEDRSVGITLSVRPRITATRDVDLLIDFVLSSLSGQTTNAGGLIFDRRRTQTRVIIKDRQTVVISGILKEQESNIVRKVPILGEIPLLGLLFTSTNRESTTSELIAFITPIVVDNPSESYDLNREPIDRLDELSRPMKEQIKDPGDPWKIWRHQDASSGVEPIVPANDHPPVDDPPTDDNDDGHGDDRAMFNRQGALPDMWRPRRVMM